MSGDRTLAPEPSGARDVTHDVARRAPRSQDGGLALVALARTIGNQAFGRALSAAAGRAAPTAPSAAILQRIAEHDVEEWRDQVAGEDARYKDVAAFNAIRAALDDEDDDTASQKINDLNQWLLDQDDVAAVFAAVRAPLIQHNVTQADVAQVKAYDFDSDSVSFVAENYYQWRRMADGAATVDDVRFFLHELVEIRDLKRVDPTYAAETHHGRSPDDVEAAYKPAHLLALRAEAQFLAATLNATNQLPAVTWQQAGLADPVRADEIVSAVLFYDKNQTLATDEDVMAALNGLPALQEEYFPGQPTCDSVRAALEVLKASPPT
jgi:hypothetical protein